MLKGKRILFEVTHPKHFHQFKHVSDRLERENEILFIARNKDVVLGLLDESGYPYVKYDSFGKGLINKTLIYPMIIQMHLDLYKKFKPHYIMSRSSPYSTFASKFFKSKTIIFPDSEIVRLTKRFVAPLSDLIITPSNYSIDYGKKHRRLPGLFEESYLSPEYFKPDKSIVERAGLKPGERFFVLRFVAWQANHDVNQFGFDFSQKEQLIKSLEPHGRVLISSELPLEKSFEKFRIRIKPSEIHQILFFAHMYIGDSQSMATESALLGTPSFRYNSFVGQNDMSNFHLLQDEYGLLSNYNTIESLLSDVQKYVQEKEMKEEWQKKREMYFDKKKDLNIETIKIIESFFQ